LFADGKKPAEKAQAPVVLGDRYEILNPLGSGAMGFVYQAYDRRLNRTVAVKALSADLELDEESRKRFEAEAKVASTFNHPHVAAIYDYGVDKGNIPYIVMEFVDGESLDNILKNGNKMRVADAVLVFKQVAEGLHHAHKKGVVHRDLKPGNVIITKDEFGQETAKLVDFGLAKVVFADKSARLTKTGDVLGTPLYMSPEQITGQELDARSDIYSLGCVMFQALAGSVPFRGKDAMATAHLHVTAAMPEIGLESNPLNQRLTAIVRRCLEKKKAERFGTALDIADALNALSNDRVSGITPAITRAGTKKAFVLSPPLLALVIVGAIALAGAAFYIALQYFTANP
jgi:eukaryotic-like serine/threonine-protein kinase